MINNRRKILLNRRVRIPVANALVYNGQEQTPEWIGLDLNQVTMTGEISGTAVGTYTAIFSLKNPLLHQWMDGTVESKSVTWRIAILMVPIPSVILPAPEYTGNFQSPNLSPFSDNLISLGGEYSEKEPGTYTMTISLKDTTNCSWSDETISSKNIEWVLEKAKLMIPETSPLLYNGEVQTPTWSYYYPNLMVISGQYAAKDQGIYSATFSILDSQHYMWVDSTSGSKDVSWTIGPLKGQIISIDLGDGKKNYRILKNNGYIAELLAMDDYKSVQGDDSLRIVTFSNGLTGQEYVNSNIDKELQSLYNSLSEEAKNAIVPKDIAQDMWYSDDSGDPVYTEFGIDAAGHEDQTFISNANGSYPIGLKNIYVLSVQDVIDYLSDVNVRRDKDKLWSYWNIWKLFYNMRPEDYPRIWLRSSSATRLNRLNTLNIFFAHIGTGNYTNTAILRPVFQIDLSKIEWE